MKINIDKHKEKLMDFKELQEFLNKFNIPNYYHIYDDTNYIS